MLLLLCALFIAGVSLVCYKLCIVRIRLKSCVLCMVISHGIFETDFALIVQQEICCGTAVYAGQDKSNPAPAVKSFGTAGYFAFATMPLPLPGCLIACKGNHTCDLRHACFLQAIRNGVQEVAIKILAAADEAQLKSFKKVSCNQLQS